MNKMRSPQNAFLKSKSKQILDPHPEFFVTESIKMRSGVFVFFTKKV
jgi:hypothetical protein